MSRHNTDREFDDWATDSMMAVLLALLMLAGALLAGMLMATITEIARIYLDHAGKRNQAARLLWIAAIALAGAWLLAALLAFGLAMIPAALYLATWSFLAFVIAVEIVALVAARNDHVDYASLSDLDSYLAPFTPPAPGLNGRYGMPAAAFEHAGLGVAEQEGVAR